METISDLRGSGGPGVSPVVLKTRARRPCYSANTRLFGLADTCPVMLVDSQQIDGSPSGDGFVHIGDRCFPRPSSEPKVAGEILLAGIKAAVGTSGLEFSVAGEFASEGRDYAISRFRFTGPAAGHEPVRLGLFAGVHGDEPAGCAALVEFVEGLVADPARARGYDLFVYPIVNPTGCEDGTRTNRAGKDLNREFWRDSAEPEVQILEAEL